MDNWGIFLAIGELVAFLVLVAKPLIALTTTLTKLDDTVETLKATLENQREHSSKVHKKLWDHNDKQDDRIEDHERRITVIEQKDVNKKEVKQK